MLTETTKLTVRLPREDIAFAKEYAKANGLTVTEVIDRHLRRMRALEQYTPPPALDEITGLLPESIDARAEMARHQKDKHGA